MSRQIEIDSSGCLCEVDGPYIECPLKTPTRDMRPKLCTENCAWFSISKLHRWFTVEEKDFKKNIAYCGNKTIGEIKKEE